MIGRNETLIRLARLQREARTQAEERRSARLAKQRAVRLGKTSTRKGQA